MGAKRDKSPEIRAKIALDLEQLAQLLLRENLVQDVGPLFGAASECRTDSSRNGNWAYSIANLVFRRMGQFKVFQKNFDFQTTTIEMSIVVEGKCEPNEYEDPLIKLGLNILVSGNYGKQPDKINTALSTWHLDKDTSSNDVEFMHPLYHFTFGGIHIEPYCEEPK